MELVDAPVTDARPLLSNERRDLLRFLMQVDLAVGGTWLLVSNGSARWSLDEGTVEAPDASAEFADDAAWRWLTGAALPPEGVRLHGPSQLCQPLLGVRGIIV